MKRILLLTAFATLLFTACKEEKNSGTPPYITDDLTVSQEKNALLIFGYAKGVPTNAVYEWMRLVEEDYNGNKLNTFSPVSGVGGTLYHPIADTLSQQFGPGAAPYYLINSDPTDLIEVHDEIELALLKKPIAGVAHKVSVNDTAYLIDIKVEFFKDTVAEIYVETYMLADVPAKNYPDLAIDLRHSASQDLVANSDQKSVWDREIKNYDSTTTLVNKGDDFIMQNIMLATANYPKPFGKLLSGYWPFGDAYQRKDILGYKSTAIRNYFLKPSLWINEPKYEFENIRFLTVLWLRNPVSGATEPLCSYIN